MHLSSRINNSLKQFAKALNKHPLRTAYYWVNSFISQNLDIEVPDIQEFGIDEKTLPEEQLNTVSVPVTLSCVDYNVVEAFMNYVKCSTCSILNYENDYISEFVAAKSFLLELL